MFEKVNPNHPDKVADRIAGAIVDLAYRKEESPKIAVELLIGHGRCFLIIESSVLFDCDEIQQIVKRISGITDVTICTSKQDHILAGNQSENIRCGDNGIFRGMPITEEQKELTAVAKKLYERYKTDGKYILADKKYIICQSNAYSSELQEYDVVNPLGFWSGGLDVDSGAVNRKLGSDMGDAVTGGGLHGKDLSKADVSVNIYAHLKAQQTQKPVELNCAIGDEYIDGIPYYKIVEIAKNYIHDIGGFEKFAEWGIIR